MYLTLIVSGVFFYKSCIEYSYETEIKSYFLQKFCYMIWNEKKNLIGAQNENKLEIFFCETF